MQDFKLARLYVMQGDRHACTHAPVLTQSELTRRAGEQAPDVPGDGIA